MIIQITNKQYIGQKYSYTWENNIVTIKHNLNSFVISQIYDPDNKLVYMDVQKIDNNTLTITFPFDWMPRQGYTYSLILISAKEELQPSGDLPTFEYYAGTIQDVLLFCKSLNIGNGKLSKITDQMVQKYMNLINGHIDGYLQQYYFVPVRRYNRVRYDGTIQKVFPGKIRLVALQWTAGLLLQSQFQNLQPNQTQAISKYIQQARKQIYQLTIYNARIPGLRWKANGISHFAPPELMPSKNPQRMQ